MSETWRSEERLIIEELGILATKGVTPETIARWAPTILRTNGSPELAHRNLVQFFEWEQPDDRNLQAARIWLGLDPRFTDPRKQQRLSDAAEYFGRTGWRNMYRWAQRGIELYASQPAIYGLRRHKHFLFVLTHTRGQFQLETFYQPPEEVSGEVFELLVRLNQSCIVYWTPDESETLTISGPPTQQLPIHTWQHVFAAGWNATAPGGAELITELDVGWNLWIKHGFQGIDVFARRVLDANWKRSAMR